MKRIHWSGLALIGGAAFMMLLGGCATTQKIEQTQVTTVQPPHPHPRPMPRRRRPCQLPRPGSACRRATRGS